MSKIDHKTVSRVFLLIIVTVALILIIRQLTMRGSEFKDFNLLSDGWTLDGQEVSLPVDMEPKPGKTYRLSHRLPENYTGNDVVLFKSENIFWKLSVGNRIIDEFTPEDVAPGMTAGDHWNLVMMPEGFEGKEFTLEICATYGFTPRLVKEVFFVDRRLASEKLIQKFIPGYSLCIFSIACALMIIMSNIVLTDPKNRDLTLCYLGLFVIFMSTWSIGQNPILSMIYNRNTASVFITYMSMPLAVGFSTLYYVKIARFPWNIPNKIAAILPFVAFFVYPVLELTGILPFGVSVIFTRILMINLSLMTFFASNRIIYRQALGRNSSILIALGTLALLCVTWLDVYQSTYMNGNDYTKNTRVLIFIYMLAVSYDRLVVFSGIRRKMEEAKIMGRMAFIDGLTGVQNRLAFNKKTEEIKEPANIAFVSFDVNNLKSTNDGYGHVEGDKLICMASQIITSAFSFTDYIYRYGGDEFVVIIENADMDTLEQAIEQLETMEEKINETGDFHLPFAIAYGYAVYDAEKDKALPDTLVRADHNMYKKKNIMKQELL